MKTRLLLVEDDPAITELIRYNVEKEGYALEAAEDGEDGLALAEDTSPDLVLLDWMLPNLSGIEICRRLRANQKTRGIPIIMLTARGEEADKVRGLDTGADDYITKPFSPKELVSRIKAVLRRLRPALGDELLKFSDIELDPATYKATRAGRKLDLSPTEFRLLLHFLENPGRVYSRAQLLESDDERLGQVGVVADIGKNSVVFLDLFQRSVKTRFPTTKRHVAQVPTDFRDTVDRQHFLPEPVHVEDVHHGYHGQALRCPACCRFVAGFVVIRHVLVPPMPCPQPGHLTTDFVGFTVVRLPLQTPVAAGKSGGLKNPF